MKTVSGNVSLDRAHSVIVQCQMPPLTALRYAGAMDWIRAQAGKRKQA